jgi:predicted site-specific integrase-resolvase
LAVRKGILLWTAAASIQYLISDDGTQTALYLRVSTAEQKPDLQ